MTTVEQGDESILRSGFDHGTDPALLDDIAGEWNRLREESRTFSSDAYPWTNWYVTRFDDVFEVFRDTERFSSRQTNYNVTDTHRWIPAQVDPPEHTSYRTALNPMFGPGAIAEMETKVRAVSASLIAGFAADGECDMVIQFAQRFPTAIFLQMMGLPLDDTDTFLEWAHQMMHTPGADAAAVEIRKNGARTIYRYMRQMIADRRANPGVDVVSTLLGVQIGDHEITDDELLEIAMLMYVAGMDTVAGMLTYVVQHLALHPQDREYLLADTSRVPAAVEEFLRYYSIASPARLVRDDVEYAGCPMHKGDRVVLATWPANRDPRQFDDADTFVIDREGNRHSAFGIGIHRCIGSNLARLEIRIAIEEWLARIPNFSIAAEAVITQHVGGAAGLDTLPLVWG